MAVSTEFGVIRRNLITDCKALDRFSDLDNDPTGFVAGDDRHLGVEVAIVDVQICSADATRFHCANVRLYISN